MTGICWSISATSCLGSAVYPYAAFWERVLSGTSFCAYVQPSTNYFRTAHVAVDVVSRFSSFVLNLSDFFRGRFVEIIICFLLGVAFLQNCSSVPLRSLQKLVFF